MSCVASFHSGFEACFVCDIVCNLSRCSWWPRSPVASKKVSFVVSSARGRTLPSGAASGCFWGVTGKLLGAPGTPWGASWGAFRTSWEAYWGSERALGADKTQKLKSLFSLRNSLVFEIPGAPKASQHRPGVASRGLGERAEVASSVFGRAASSKEAPKLRHPAEISRATRRVKSKSLSKWL